MPLPNVPILNLLGVRDRLGDANLHKERSQKQVETVPIAPSR